MNTDAAAASAAAGAASAAALVSTTAFAVVATMVAAEVAPAAAEAAAAAASVFISHWFHPGFILVSAYVGGHYVGMILRLSSKSWMNPPLEESAQHSSLKGCFL